MVTEAINNSINSYFSSFFSSLGNKLWNLITSPYSLLFIAISVYLLWNSPIVKILFAATLVFGVHIAVVKLREAKKVAKEKSGELVKKAKKEAKEGIESLKKEIVAIQSKVDESAKEVRKALDNSSEKLPASIAKALGIQKKPWYKAYYAEMGYAFIILLCFFVLKKIGTIQKMRDMLKGNNGKGGDWGYEKQNSLLTLLLKAQAKNRLAQKNQRKAGKKASQEEEKPKIGFTEPRIVNVKPITNQSDVKNAYTLGLHLGVPQEEINRFATYSQALEMLVEKKQIDPRSLKLFLNEKGRILMPWEKLTESNQGFASLDEKIKQLDRFARIKERQVRRQINAKIKRNFRDENRFLQKKEAEKIRRLKKQERREKDAKANKEKIEEEELANLEKKLQKRKARASNGVKRLKKEKEQKSEERKKKQQEREKRIKENKELIDAEESAKLEKKVQEREERASNGLNNLNKDKTKKAEERKKKQENKNERIAKNKQNIEAEALAKKHRKEEKEAKKAAALKKKNIELEKTNKARIKKQEERESKAKDKKAELDAAALANKEIAALEREARASNGVKRLKKEKEQKSEERKKKQEEREKRIKENRKAIQSKEIEKKKKRNEKERKRVQKAEKRSREKEKAIIKHLDKVRDRFWDKVDELDRLEEKLKNAKIVLWYPHPNTGKHLPVAFFDNDRAEDEMVDDVSKQLDERKWLDQKDKKYIEKTIKWVPDFDKYPHVLELTDGVRKVVIRHQQKILARGVGQGGPIQKGGNLDGNQPLVQGNDAPERSNIFQEGLSNCVRTQIKTKAAKVTKKAAEAAFKKTENYKTLKNVFESTRDKALKSVKKLEIRAQLKSENVALVMEGVECTSVGEAIADPLVKKAKRSLGYAEKALQKGAKKAEKTIKSAKSTYNEGLKKGIETTKNNLASKSFYVKKVTDFGTGAAFGIGMDYLVPAIAVCKDVYKGENKKIAKKMRKIDQSNLPAASKTWKKCNVVGDEIYKNLPKIKNSLVKNAQSQAGSMIGTGVGSLGGPLTGFAGGVIGGMMGPSVLTPQVADNALWAVDKTNQVIDSTIKTCQKIVEIPNALNKMVEKIL